MKLGLIMAENERETLFNALRLANRATDEGDEVTVFLLGQGVELDRIEDERFDVRGQAQSLLDGVVASTGSACHEGSISLSPVLEAMASRPTRAWGPYGSAWAAQRHRTRWTRSPKV